MSEKPSVGDDAIGVFVRGENVTVWIPAAGIEYFRRLAEGSLNRPASDEASMAPGKEEAEALAKAILGQADRLREFAAGLREKQGEGTFQFSTGQGAYYVDASPQDPNDPDFMQMAEFAPDMDYSLDIMQTRGDKNWQIGRVYFEGMRPPNMEEMVHGLWKQCGFTIERVKEKYLKDGRIRWEIIARHSRVKGDAEGETE